MIVIENKNKKRYRIQFSLTKESSDRYCECCKLLSKLNLSINLLEEFGYWFDEILYNIEYELRYYQNNNNEKIISSIIEPRNIG